MVAGNLWINALWGTIGASVAGGFRIYCVLGVCIIRRFLRLLSGFRHAYLFGVKVNQFVVCVMVL